MSTKFIVVKEEPKELPKGAMVIKSPDFLEEVLENKSREPRGGYTAPTHLRYIVGRIGEKYDQELSAYTIKPHLFEGRKYDSDKQLAEIVVEMLKAQYPKIFDSYLDYKIRHRPTTVNLIYFVGDYKNTSAFYKNGIDLAVEDKEEKKSARKAKTEEVEAP